MKVRTVAAVSAIALATLAGSAQAAFINGSAGMAGGVAAGGLTNLPNSLVNGLSSFDLTGTAIGTNGVGDLAPILAALGTISDFTRLPAANNTFSLVVGGFTFSSLSFSNVNSGPFICSPTSTGGLCNDSQQFDITGVVDDGAGGFSPTAFLMQFGLTGSCVEDPNAPGTCGSSPVGNWNATVSATGQEPPQLPEPASLALMGLALGALRMSRKSQKA